MLITLTIVTVMIAITLEMNRQMRESITDVAVTRDRITLSHMVQSGINVASAMLAKERKATPVVSLQDDWADPQAVSDYVKQLTFDNGSISVHISDELSRLQINALVAFPAAKNFNPDQRNLWGRFFELLLSQEKNQPNAPAAIETLEPDMIINPVKDWLDSGDNDAITGLSGAENDYYMSLDPPYHCRNGPFRQIRELMRVKNITPELFAGIDKGAMGIGNYITVYGMTSAGNDQFTYPGKININTAPMPIIAALLPSGQAFLAQGICDYRLEKAGGAYIHDLSNPAWYKNAPGCSGVTIKPDLITTQSDLFQIECNADLNGETLSAIAVVVREKNKKSGKWYCKVLNWTWE